MLGFLKFLKKSKEDKLDIPLEGDLDMPPPPPVAPKHKLSPMPKSDVKPFSEIEEEDISFPDLEPPKEPEFTEELAKPPMSKPPEIPGFEEKTKPPATPRLTPPPKRIKPHIPHIEEMEKAAVMEEKALLRHGTTPSKPIYVEIEKFKEIQRSAILIRNDLRNASEILIKLHNIKEDKDKKFNKWQKLLEDIQKKMIFMDKAFFKGD